MNIVAEMREDTVEPYFRYRNKIPIVIESDHPRFPVGKRLDWGFVQVAIREGYTVTIKPYIE